MAAASASTSRGAAAQLVALLRSRPGPGASPRVWAVWLEAKAGVFDAVAAESTSAGLAAEAAECATAARRRAAMCRAAAAGAGVCPDGAA